MRKGFTLIELLTVVMLMGVLGTAAIGGYRAMQRGMEERGVMQNANSAIRAVYQRAQIDRQPTLIFFWNETIRSETMDDNAIVVGKAVAVRRHGRLSNVKDGKLIDEFGDLNLAYPASDDEEDNSSQSSGSNKDTMYLYPMDKLREMTSMKRSLVSTRVVALPERDAIYLSLTDKPDNGEIATYAFEVIDKGGVDWKPGTAYGCEFLSIQLPHGYIFGDQFSNSADDPVREAGSFVFKPGLNDGSGLTTGGTVGGSAQIDIYMLKQSADGDSLKAVKIGRTDSPERSL